MIKEKCTNISQNSRKQYGVTLSVNKIGGRRRTCHWYSAHALDGAEVASFRNERIASKRREHSNKKQRDILFNTQKIFF